MGQSRSSKNPLNREMAKYEKKWRRIFPELFLGLVLFGMALSTVSMALAEVSPSIVPVDSRSRFFGSALVGEGPVTAAMGRSVTVA